MPLQSSDLNWYADKGFTLFPLNGKIPPKGFSWPKAVYNPFPSVQDFPSGNFGVKLGADTLVIDVDPRNFAAGVDSWAKLKSACPIFDKSKFNNTFVVMTGTGGFHIYLNKPVDCLIVGRLKEYPGIDFKSKGGYVVGLGSIHPETGKAYVGKPCELADATPELLELIGRKARPLAKGTGLFTADEQTIRRFTEYLKTAQIAIEGESGDSTTFAVAAVGHDFGLPAGDTYDLMLKHYNDRCEPPWSAEELERKVQNAYKYAESPAGNLSPVSVEFPMVSVTEIEFDPEKRILHRDSHGFLKKDQFNTAAFLCMSPAPLEGLLGFDQFSLQITFLKRAPWWAPHENHKIWNDGEAMRCRHWLSNYFKFEPRQETMKEAAFVASKHFEFHPVKQYLESLHWDGHPRAARWMIDLLGAVDNEYTRAVGLKTLLAAVKRIYHPGCKFDYITVLEGNQGTGKSTAWKLLAGEEWFSDTPIDISKEWSIMKTFGKWFYEWAEMETHRKSDTEAMRAFLSSATDRVRLPYESAARDIPRQGVFVGSFNPEKDPDIGWLRDTTGNRRYWPVLTGVNGKIKTDKILDLRDQLWAEIMSMKQVNLPVHFEDARIEKQAEEEQMLRMGRDPWQDSVLSWLNADYNAAKLVVRGDEIFTECLGGNMVHFTLREKKRLAKLMENLGWQAGVWYNPEIKGNTRGFRRPSLV